MMMMRPTKVKMTMLTMKKLYRQQYLYYWLLLWYGTIIQIDVGGYDADADVDADDDDGGGDDDVADKLDNQLLLYHHHHHL